MSQFVCFEAEDNHDVSLENESCEVEMMSDTEFIDNIEYNESVENYYAFENVSREYDDATGDSFAGFDFLQKPSNYCSDDEICNKFKDFNKRWKSLIKH